ncbi:HAD-IIIA family hydrolase [Alloacidobacterium dinghuense]|uniref:D,D-heptose 1,7-bisphosphate phosphatase n=1 Tax=Alloacidobacterium dinghuense TaxID=2763107 RepID=A0A7G8BJH0_9BACT|nr:HAD-IIIA family hydrolase [Alloacidobacterium dinghuense]QNI32690.1 HAD-IIIA family hydrolase [Alloacidobacterium dinghuense]
MRRAVFLDRDGVLNSNIWNPATGAYESPLRPEQFELLPKVISALHLLQDDGYLLFLVSNQPNYAKGKATMRTLDAIHRRLETAMLEACISFAAYYYCLHHPLVTGDCFCRKPSPYFLLKARDLFALDLRQSWMIGDRQTDIECGLAAGARTIGIGALFPPAAEADHIAADLWQAAQIIVRDLNS